MKFNQIFLVLLVIGLNSIELLAQQNPPKFTLSGYIRDIENGEDLIGATIRIKELEIGTITNVYGFYSLTIPKGEYTMEVTFIGFKTHEERISLSSSITKNINLESSLQQLEEVVISAEAEDKNVTSVQSSVEKMSMTTLKEIPQLLGEADVIRSIQLRPGVTSVGEGASGFNVRGGNIDQNLILLDEAPVYNSSHLFGFFSVFNPDAIKDVTLYKGGIPARYGGRLSSVMDVRQREGNDKKFSGSGGIGALFSRITLEGPIVKDKVSFLVSGRRSYADLFLQLTEDFKGNKAYFYDLNGKINYKINEQNRLFLSGYYGQDIFGFGTDFNMQWGNATGSARWNRVISDKLFMNLTAIYSDYAYSLGIPEGTQGFEWSSRIVTMDSKLDFTHYLSPKLTLEYGGQFQFYQFYPGKVEGLGSESIVNTIEVQKENALMPSIYIAAEHELSKKLKLAYGLRYTHFFNVGEYNLNLYAYGIPTTANDIVGQRFYDKGEVVADYGGLEPRFSINYIVNSKQSVKGSYQRTKQYMHLVSNTTAASPVDIWQPAGYYIKPATSNQYVLGYFRNFRNNAFEFSIETYYKQMFDLLDYRNGAELLLNDNLETELLQGDGNSYGMELMISKKKGLLTGWISYTLSRTTMQVPGFVAGGYTEMANGINMGNPYPTNWDKTHDLSVVAMYSLTDRWKLSSTFIFMTGRPATYPNGRFIWDGKVLPDYRTRNANRIENTNRLDISATYDMAKEGKKWKSSISFGVYNVYGRKNPYSVYFTQDEDSPTGTAAERLAIIGIPVPFVTYNFKF